MSGPLHVTVTLSAEQVDLIAERVAAILAGPQQTQQGRWLTIEQAADLIGAKRQRIYDLRAKGRLSKTGDGGRVLIDRHELDALIERGLT